MVKVKLIGNEYKTLENNSKEGMYIDGYLKSDLDQCKKLVHDDWDMFFVIDGEEGSGKSVHAMQIASFLDPTFDIDRITYSPFAFKKSIDDNTEPYKAYLYDEGFSGMSSRRSGSYINHVLNSLFSKVRRKKLFIILVMPSFFELDKYPAIHRSRCLIHVYADKSYKRGYFGMYSRDRKRKLYMEGKRYYNYSVKPNYIGRFTNYYPVSEKEYRDQKEKKSTKGDVDFVDGGAFKDQRDSVIRYFADKGIKHKELAQSTQAYTEAGITEEGIKKLIYRARKKEEAMKLLEAEA